MSYLSKDADYGPDREEEKRKTIVKIHGCIQGGGWRVGEMESD